MRAAEESRAKLEAKGELGVARNGRRSAEAERDQLAKLVEDLQGQDSLLRSMVLTHHEARALERQLSDAKREMQEGKTEMERLREELGKACWRILPRLE